MRVGNVQQAAGDPCVIFILPVQPGEGVIFMRVKACRDQDEFGLVSLQRRENLRLIGRAHGGAARARAKGDVDDLAKCAPLMGRPGAGIERHLMA